MQNLTLRVLIAMVAGGFLGGLLYFTGSADWIDEYLINGLFLIVGKWFVAFLKLMIVPLVVVSLINGVTGLKETSDIGRIGIRAIGLYLLTTAVAISIALTIASAVSPGSGLSSENIPGGSASFEPKPSPPLTDVFINFVPSNVFDAMANANMLQLIVFSILFGIAINASGERGKPVRQFFRDFDPVIMKMVELIMLLAPYGVFVLIARQFATFGWNLAEQLVAYMLALTFALAVQALIVYPSMLKLFTGLNPVTFLRKMREPASFAFSTASSGATIPITLRTVEKKMGVDNSVASFSVPLGATINMDGTAMMQGVATIFIANVYGISLGFEQFLLIILTATLASVGTAAVPGAGLIMLGMVLNQVGLPIEGIALIIGVDRLLDMMRTAVNVTGDSAISCIVASGCKEHDREVFDDPQAGNDETEAMAKASR